MATSRRLRHRVRPSLPLLALLALPVLLHLLPAGAQAQAGGFNDFNVWQTVAPQTEQPSARAWHSAVAYNASRMIVFAGVMIEGSSTRQRAFFRCFNDLWTYHAHDSFWASSKTVGAAAAAATAGAARGAAQASTAGGSRQRRAGDRWRVGAAAVPPGRGSHTAVLLSAGGRQVMLVYAGFGCSDDFQVGRAARGRREATRTVRAKGGGRDDAGERRERGEERERREKSEEKRERGRSMDRLLSLSFSLPLVFSNLPSRCLRFRLRGRPAAAMSLLAH